MLKRIKKNISPIWVTNGMRILLLFLLFFEIYNQNVLLSISALSALLLSVFPSYAFKNYYITLPRVVEMLVAAVLLLHIVGLSFDLYHNVTYWWWDNMTHFFGTAVIALLAFEFIFTLNYLGRIKMTERMLMLFTFSTAMAMGALWEISEFNFDQIFKTQSLGDVYDTIEDLQFDVVGAALVSIFGYRYKQHLMKSTIDASLLNKLQYDNPLYILDNGIIQILKQNNNIIVLSEKIQTFFKMMI